MSNLAVLGESRTFPPKIFYLLVWLATLVLTLYGIFATPDPGPILFVWIGVAAVAVWQLWTIYWVRIDGEGIRVNNILQRTWRLRWDEITTFHEEDIKLNKRVYSIVDLSNKPPEGKSSGTNIRLTSDQN